MASATSSRSPEECDRWVQRVHAVQSKRSPEAWQQARERLEQARQQEVSLRKCKAVKSHTVRSRALAAEGLRQLSTSQAPEEYRSVRARWMAAQSASASRQARALDMLSAPTAAACAAAPLREAEAEEDEAMREVAELVGAQDAGLLAAMGTEGLPSGRGPAGAAGPAQDGEDDEAGLAFGMLPAPSGAVEALLAQLKAEPAGEAESAAKFSLYEGYASEVEKMRGTLLQFHQESRTTVPAAVAKDMDKQVRGIDNADAMGIPDDTREWFVYHMMRQSERNNVNMARILDGFEKRLEFLASNQQLECPICLEAFQEGGEHAPETLGCCHKVCKECWENWSAVMHGRPFCPLCRNEEFLGAVAERLSGSTSL